MICRGATIDMELSVPSLFTCRWLPGTRFTGSTTSAARAGASRLSTGIKRRYHSKGITGVVNPDMAARNTTAYMATIRDVGGAVPRFRKHDHSAIPVAIIRVSTRTKVLPVPQINGLTLEWPSQSSIATIHRRQVHTWLNSLQPSPGSPTDYTTKKESQVAIPNRTC